MPVLFGPSTMATPTFENALPLTLMPGASNVAPCDVTNALGDVGLQSTIKSLYTLHRFVLIAPTLGL